MVWIGLSVGFVIFIGLLAVLVGFDRRARKDLGSVSETWMSGYRVKSSDRYPLTTIDGEQPRVLTRHQRTQPTLALD